MKKTYTQQHDDEPMGIVISRGSRAEPTPVFAAYIWGPIPDPSVDASKAA